MDAKEDTSLSGSASVSSDTIETVNDTNGFNFVNKIDGSSNNDNFSSLNTVSDDETDGFASGEEEAFETILDDNLVLENETLANVDEGDDSFSEASEFLVPKVESATVDDAEKVSLDLVENFESDSKLNLDSKVDKAASEIVKSGGTDEVENEVVVANGVKVTTEGDSVVEEIKVDTPAPGVAVVTDADEVLDEDDDDEDDVLLVGGSDDTNTVVETETEIEKVGLDSVVADDVKVTSEGDSVAEAVESDFPPPPVAAEVAAVAEVNVGTPDLAYEDDVKVISEGDSVIKAVESDLPPPPVAAEVAADTIVETPVANEEKVTSEPEFAVESRDVDLPPPEVVAEVAAVTNVETPVLESDVVNEEKVASEPESVVESRDVDLPPPEVAAVTNVETPVLESVVANEEKVTSEQEPVVESRDVDLPPPPVAAEVAAVETETPDLESVDTNDVKMATSEQDSVVEAVNVDLPIPGVTGVAVVTQAVEDGGDVAVTDEKIDRVLEEVVDKEVVGVVTDGKFSPLEVEDSANLDVEQEVDFDIKENGLENVAADKFVVEDSAEKDETDEEEEDTKQFMEELEAINGGESSQDRSQIIDGQIVTDSDEEDDDDDEEEDGKGLFDSAALAALLKAAADGGSQDGSRLFTVERPAGLGPSLRANPRPARSNIFNALGPVNNTETEINLTEDERKKLEKLQAIRVKFLRLVHKLGLSTEESVAAQVLYRLALIAGRQTGQSFSLEAAKREAMELESEENNDVDFSVNILVVGKAGVGKSATINSIFGEEKTVISAFRPATDSVKKITGLVNGVMVNVFDTPGLKVSAMEQAYNRSVLSSAKKFTKKSPPDIVLYVDRLDAQTRDVNDIPLLKTITGSLGPSIWRSAIVTLTHGASAPPEGANGQPLSYEMFVTQRSHVVQQAIGHAVGDLRMMSPSLMHPVSLVENHELCRKNRDGQKVLPNGQTWRPQLLMLCYSMKILAEANALTKPQDPFDNRKLFGFRVRSPPLPYMLSSMLQSRAHPKLSSEQGGDGGDSDADLAELTDSDREEDGDEYDQLPPFKPLKKTQLSKLSKEQKKAYFDEYDYRVKLLQKKQFKEEIKRIKEMKKKGSNSTEQSFPEEDGDGDAPAPVAVPLPDMALPPSFDSDNPGYRFRFLEPTSQFLARPVLDTHGWDHDCGYDGVNVEQTLAIANRFPANVSVQVTKDKKDFSINLDSSVSAKHGENTSTMAGFDIQPIGKQLAYIVRGETKFKNLKKNKTAAGMSVTFLGENVVTGFKLEDQITLGRQYSVIGSAGTVRFQTDSAYGANVEIQRRELDYPIGQIQSTVGLSIIKWRGDLALGLNSLAQFSAGRNSKVAVRAGINNKMSGQITVKTSSSEHLVLALAAVIPSVISAYKKFWPTADEKYSAY